jgi:hypothetical protein
MADGSAVTIQSDGSVVATSDAARFRLPSGPAHVTAFDGLSPTDLWAAAVVGDRPIFARFDGTGWQVAGVTYPGSSSWPDVIATLRVTGPSDAVATGDSGAVYRFDGVAWTAEAPVLPDAILLEMPGAAGRVATDH